MKGSKKLTGLVVTVLAIALLSIGAFAAVEYSSGEEIVADLTGQTQEAIAQQRLEQDLTCGEIAQENGVFEEFRASMSEIREGKMERIGSQNGEFKGSGECSGEAIRAKKQQADGLGDKAQTRMGRRSGLAE